MTATQAFLKHANPSQGITEPLIQEAMEAFGEVLKVEIDKRKGFAYVDFAEPSGLQKAIKASPVKVAQGQVNVAVRKDKPTTNAAVSSRGNRTDRGRGGHGGGRGRGGRGRGNVQVPSTTPAAATTAMGTTSAATGNN